MKILLEFGKIEKFFIARKKGEVEKLKRELGTFKKENQRLNATLADKEGEIGKLQKDIKEKEAENAKLASELEHALRC